RLKLQPSDRLLRAWLSRLWPGWQQALAFVQPRTVLVWQKKRFCDYWRGLSQKSHLGRPAIAQEVRERIRDMWRSNPTWGSPRIVGELRKLGINGAKSTAEKYRPRGPKPSSPTWKAFLKNHVKDIVACDFFTVPTASFKVLFVFIMLAHERRRIVHFNITEHPTARFLLMVFLSMEVWMAIGLGVGFLLHWLVPAIGLGMAALIGSRHAWGLFSVAQSDFDPGCPLRTRRQRST